MIHTYKEKLNLLFHQWRQRSTVEIAGQTVRRVSFNEDGIVNPEKWFSLPADKRILFVLKETHDDTKDSWSLTDLLNRSGKEKNRTKNECNYKIWRRAAEWTKGILSTCAETPIEAYKRMEGKDSKQQIQNIAVLNLKKTPGGSTAKWEEIDAYAQEDIALIEREIEIIDPAIVLFGGTFWYFQKACADTVFPMDEELRFCYASLAGKERLLIDFWHPANHYPAITSYYGITGIYQAALKKKAQCVCGKK